jgi:RNA polymerase sigma-70 factor (ECF subfamily)
MLPPSLDLLAVLVQAQRGSRAAIGDLYDAYGAVVYRYCYARLSDREDAEDCVQEVFISIWKGVRTFEYRGDASFMAWMYKIASNVLISHARKHKSTQHVPLTPELNLPDVRSADPARIICDELALREAIDQLTPEQQHVVLLKFFVGLRNDEIATVLHRSEGAVKALQHRATQRLKPVLATEHAA